MATVERSILVVTEERAVIDVNTLYIFHTTNVIERHVKLFGLGKEVRAGREKMLRMWRRQWRSLSLRSRRRSSMILHVFSYSNTRGGSSRDRTLLEPLFQVPVVSWGEASSSTGDLACRCWSIGLHEFLRVRSLSIPRRGLNTIFDSKIFKDPFSGLLGFISSNFALCFLESLEAISTVKRE